jgi:hypothetical protein
MAQATSTHVAAHTTPEASLLFKPDRPRAIDRHIDYFGGVGTGRAETDTAADSCGESLLERLA